MTDRQRCEIKDALLQYAKEKEIKRIYISGKITDDANYKVNFEVAELALETADFLQRREIWRGDIITNPPYKNAAEFVQLA